MIGIFTGVPMYGSPLLSSEITLGYCSGVVFWLELVSLLMFLFLLGAPVENSLVMIILLDAPVGTPLGMLL